MRAHPREAGEAAAPGRVQEDRLGLVVSRVTRRDAGRAQLVRGAPEERVAELARGLLARRRRGGAADPDRRAVPLRQVRDELGVLGRRARAEAMVEVRDVQVEAQLRREVGEEQEECRGIRATGDRHHNAARCRLCEAVVRRPGVDINARHVGWQ